MSKPVDDSHEADADAIGDAQPPNWLGCSRGAQPAIGDEFDVRLHRHEVELLVDLLQRLSQGQHDCDDPDFQASYRMRAGVLQDMLDNPLGGWVERGTSPADVHRLVLVMRATLRRALGTRSVTVFEEELQNYHLLTPERPIF